MITVSNLFINIFNTILERRYLSCVNMVMSEFPPCSRKPKDRLIILNPLFRDRLTRVFCCSLGLGRVAFKITEIWKKYSYL